MSAVPPKAEVNSEHFGHGLDPFRAGALETANCSARIFTAVPASTFLPRVLKVMRERAQKLLSPWLSTVALHSRIGCSPEKACAFRRITGRVGRMDVPLVRRNGVTGTY
jgi:hypothetical protein